MFLRIRALCRLICGWESALSLIPLDRPKQRKALFGPSHWSDLKTARGGHSESILNRRQGQVLTLSDRDLDLAPDLLAWLAGRDKTEFQCWTFPRHTDSTSGRSFFRLLLDRKLLCPLTVPYRRPHSDPLFNNTNTINTNNNHTKAT